MASEQTVADVPATLWQADAQLCDGYVSLTFGGPDPEIPATHNSSASLVPGMPYIRATFRVATTSDGMELTVIRGDVTLRVNIDGDEFRFRCELGQPSDNFRLWPLKIRGLAL